MDAEKRRNLQYWKQRHAQIPVNPDTPEFLERFENADASRRLLLQTQRLQYEPTKAVLKAQSKRKRKQKKGAKRSLRGEVAEIKRKQKIFEDPVHGERYGHARGTTGGQRRYKDEQEPRVFGEGPAPTLGDILGAFGGGGGGGGFHWDPAVQAERQRVADRNAQRNYQLEVDRLRLQGRQFDMNARQADRDRAERQRQFNIQGQRDDAAAREERQFRVDLMNEEDRRMRADRELLRNEEAAQERLRHTLRQDARRREDEDRAEDLRRFELRHGLEERKVEHAERRWAGRGLEEEEGRERQRAEGQEEMHGRDEGSFGRPLRPHPPQSPREPEPEPPSGGQSPRSHRTGSWPSVGRGSEPPTPEQGSSRGPAPLRNFFDALRMAADDGQRERVRGSGSLHRAIEDQPALGLEHVEELTEEQIAEEEAEQRRRQQALEESGELVQGGGMSAPQGERVGFGGGAPQSRPFGAGEQHGGGFQFPVEEEGGAGELQPAFGLGHGEGEDAPASQLPSVPSAAEEAREWNKREMEERAAAKREGRKRTKKPLRDPKGTPRPPGWRAEEPIEEEGSRPTTSSEEEFTTSSPSSSEELGLSPAISHEGGGGVGPGMPQDAPAPKPRPGKTMIQEEYSGSPRERVHQLLETPSPTGPAWHRAHPPTAPLYGEGWRAASPEVDEAEQLGGVPRELVRGRGQVEEYEEEDT